MTEDNSSIVCRYTAQLETENGRYVITVPNAEVEYGPLATGGAYRVTIERTTAQSQDTTATAAPSGTESQTSRADAPVAEGDQLDVEIEDLGQQGDGIARVGPGYVLIVPGSEVGDEVTVEVQEVNPSFGFAEIIAYEETEESPEKDATTEQSADGAEPDSETTNQDDNTVDHTDTNVSVVSDGETGPSASAEED